MRTSAGLLRRADRVAVTSTWLLFAALACTLPLMPLISMACPAAICPFHWKSDCAAAGTAATTTAATAADTHERHQRIRPPCLGRLDGPRAGRVAAYARGD